MRKLIAFSIASVMSFSALAGPASMLRCVAKPAEFKDAVKGAFVRVQTREGMKGTFAQYIAANGKVIAEHQIATRTPKQILTQYAPSQVRASLNKMRTALSKESLQNTLKTAGGITGDAILRFPEEAAAFFFAIGALTYGQSILDYSSNPVAVDQYLQSQKDPIGQVAFLNFMVANGLASHAMMQVFKNPSFRPFIPYLGMSVGMTASNLVHELAHIPHIKECIASIKAGKEDASCDKAYSSWTDFGYEKANEYAPTFMSMWASSMMSGIVSQCLSTGVQWTVTQVIKVVGVQAILTLTPTGWVARGGHFLIKVGQLGLFVGLDMWLNPYITKPYNMVEESNDLAEVEENLFLSLKEHKAYGWTKPTTHNLNKVLDDLDVQMTQWRNIHLEKIQMAHTSWMDFLSKITHQYQVAKDYYGHFTQNVWEKKYGRYAGKSVNIVDQTMPLHGITPNNFNAEEMMNAFVDSPGEIRTKQLETVQIVNARMKDMLKSEKVRRHMSDDDVVAFNEIRSGLMIQDPANPTKLELDRITKALLDLKDRVAGVNPCKLNISLPCKETSASLRGILGVVRSLLGNPNPLLQPGLGYAEALKVHPEFSQNIANFAFRGRNQSFRHLVTPDNPSFLTGAMMYGPSVNSALTSYKHGFATQFYPPRISADNNTDLNGSVMWGVPVPSNSVYYVEMGKRSLNNPEQFTSYGKTVYGSLAAGNIIPEILNPKENGFDAWWTKNVELQFVQAWLSYETKYQEIVSDLVKQLWNKGDSNWNGSGMRIGTMYSLRQERQIALMILGEIFKDTFPKYPEFLSPRQNSAIKHASGTDYRNGITRIAVALGGDSTLNMFAKIDANESVEFDALMAPSLREQGSTPRIDGRNFEFQNKIRESFGRLSEVIRKIKPLEITRKGKTYKVTATTVTNEEIDKAVADVKSMLQAAQLPFQVLDPNSFKAQIANKAFRTLELNADQIASFAKVANAVSYVENFEKSNGQPVNIRCQNIAKVSTATNAAQRMMQKDCEEQVQVRE